MVKPSPPGFTQFKLNGRWYVQCKKSIIDPVTGQEIQCGFTCRKDRLKPHTCTFCSLQGYVVQTPRPTDFLPAMYKMIADCNVSMNSASSASMWEFIYSCIDCGKRLNADDEPRTVYPALSRPTISRAFIARSQQLFNKDLVSFRGLLVSVVLDASSTVSDSVLDVLIVNPFLHPKPLLFDSIEEFQGTIAAYKSAAGRVVSNLARAGIDPVGFVCDNLAAQIAALDPSKPTSFQATSNRISDQILMLIRCACHTMALGIGDACRSEPLLTMTDELHSIVNILRKKPIRIELVSACPGWIPTRWSYQFKIVMWIIKHIDKLMELRLNCPWKFYDTMRKVFPTLDHILLEVAPALAISYFASAEATKYLEHDSTPACYTKLIIDDISVKSTQLINQIVQSVDQNDPTINNVLTLARSLNQRIESAIAARFQTTADGVLHEVMYYLTPSGRSAFRKKYPTFVGVPDLPEVAAYKANSFPMRQDYIKSIVEYLKQLSAMRLGLQAASYAGFEARFRTAVDEDEFVPLDDESDESEEEDEEVALANPQYNASVDRSAPRQQAPQPVGMPHFAPQPTVPAQTIPQAAAPTQVPLPPAGPVHPVPQQAVPAQTVAQQTPPNPIAPLMSKLDELARKFGKSPQAVCAGFMTWMTTPAQVMGVSQIYNQSPVQVWRALGVNPVLADLSYISQRLFAFVAHEAAAERMFSVQRAKVSAQMGRISHQMKLARIRLASTK